MSEKVNPINPDGYCAEMSGDFTEVPAWVIRRLNFLEEVLENNEKRRCPLLDEPCPDVTPDELGVYSCRTVKHCYPYLCNGSCGHNEIWVSNDEKKVLEVYRELRLYGWKNISCEIPLENQRTTYTLERREKYLPVGGRG